MIAWWVAAALAGPVDVGGYFRVMARPDLQGGNGRLGYWNLYGRLMNEGPYGLLELRYDVLPQAPGGDEPWTSVHARIEGDTVAGADANGGTLARYRMSQLFVETGNVALRDVTWRVGSLEYFYGDLGLYDLRPATLFFGALGARALYQTDHVEALVGFGDAGFTVRGLRYSAIPTAGGALRVRVPHLELGVGAEGRFEPGVADSLAAPYQTPGMTYEDWIRGEVVETYVQEFGEELLDAFPAPEARTASSWAVVGHLGFGGLGPLRWNNLFVRYERLHPDRSTLEGDVELWVTDFTDERTALTIGNEAQLELVEDRLGLAVAGLYGDQRDGDNQIVPTDFDRTYGSLVGRAQLYVTPTVHVLVESSVAREWSRNGNRYREHADSLFANSGGQGDSRGLETGDTDTRRTWQGKGGVVLNPLGPGLFARPSLRLLYGVQYSNQNNAFGNAFVDTLDQYSDFGNVERHWHQLAALEAEVWF